MHDCTRSSASPAVTNNSKLFRLRISTFYRLHRRAELSVFSVTKHHPRINTLFGTTDTVEKIHVWITVSVNLLVFIVKKPRTRPPKYPGNPSNPEVAHVRAHPFASAVTPWGFEPVAPDFVSQLNLPRYYLEINANS